MVPEVLLFSLALLLGEYNVEWRSIAFGSIQKCNRVVADGR
jgi:hypothetical protein